jgi:hypothetical protein
MLMDLFTAAAWIIGHSAKGDTPGFEMLTKDYQAAKNLLA